MPKITITADIESAQLGELLDLLAATPYAGALQVSLAGTGAGEDTNTITPRRAAPRTGVRADTGAPIMRVPAKLYALTRRITPARIAATQLTPQQRSIAAYITQHGPMGARDLESRLQMKQKAVQSALYALRHTTPPIIESVDAPDAAE